MKAKVRLNRGITLLELMATVVIIGIVAAMAVPRFQKSFERLRFRSVNQDLISTVRLARSNAITSKVPHGVYINSDNLTVTLFRDLVTPALCQFDSGDSVISVDSASLDLDYLDTDMDGNTLVFAPNGSAHFTGGGNIVAMASTESLVAIQEHNILASTGRIQSYGQYY